MNIDLRIIRPLMMPATFLLYFLSECVEEL